MQWRQAQGGVPEVEAREREREAYECGWDEVDRQYRVGVRGSTMHAKCVMRDRRYPSLRPQTPPSLVLSTGVWTRRLDEVDAWERQWKPRSLDADCRATGYAEPMIRTAADADALATWLRQYGEAK
jgi:hypothetical protein